MDSVPRAGKKKYKKGAPCCLQHVMMPVRKKHRSAQAAVPAKMSPSPPKLCFPIALTDFKRGVEVADSLKVPESPREPKQIWKKLAPCGCGWVENRSTGCQFKVGECTTHCRLPILVVGLDRMFTGSNGVLTHGHVEPFLDMFCFLIFFRPRKGN